MQTYKCSITVWILKICFYSYKQNTKLLLSFKYFLLFHLLRIILLLSLYPVNFELLSWGIEVMRFASVHRLPLSSPEFFRLKRGIKILKTVCLYICSFYVVKLPSKECLTWLCFIFGKQATSTNITLVMRVLMASLFNC